jgi:hypothetical protein
MIGIAVLALVFVRSRERAKRDRLASEPPPAPGAPAAERTPPSPVPEHLPPADATGPPGEGDTIPGLPVAIRPEELPLAPDDPRLQILAKHLSREDLRRAGFPVPPDEHVEPGDER